MTSWCGRGAALGTLLNYWNNFDRPFLNCFYSKTSPARTLQVIPVIQQRPLLLIGRFSSNDPHGRAGSRAST